jgi:hypothetical protein
MTVEPAPLETVPVPGGPSLDTSPMAEIRPSLTGRRSMTAPERPRRLQTAPGRS